MAFSNFVPEMDDFVPTVRETFFQILKPYLDKIQCCIKKDVNPSNTFFDKYFNKDKYLEYFEDCPTQFDFAEQLLQSSQFIHMCDDFFSDELNNFQMMVAILKREGLDEFGLGKREGQGFRGEVRALPGELDVRVAQIRPHNLQYPHAPGFPAHHALRQNSNSNRAIPQEETRKCIAQYSLALRP